jgi:hypothetical protein
MDPYYRTMEGFEVLVQKEWVTAGHQFNMRNGIGIYNIENFKQTNFNISFSKKGSKSNPTDQRSPIFLQFLDCVHQILSQYPLSFEFNVKFLSKIGYHLYSSRFGNFLCNHEKA